jgi:dTDP-glucose 4,6-dehydratase
MNDSVESVVNVDKLSFTENLESFKGVESNKRYVFEQIEIAEAVELKHISNNQQLDIAMHLVAESHVVRSLVRLID